MQAFVNCTTYKKAIKKLPVPLCYLCKYMVPANVINKTRMCKKILFPKLIEIAIKIVMAFLSILHSSILEHMCILGMLFTILCHTSQWLLWKFVIWYLVYSPKCIDHNSEPGIPSPPQTLHLDVMDGWASGYIEHACGLPFPPRAINIPCLVFILMFSVAIWLALWPVPLWSLLLFFFSFYFLLRVRDS